MRKVFSFILIVALLLGLNVGVFAESNFKDISDSIKADNNTTQSAVEVTSDDAIIENNSYDLKDEATEPTLNSEDVKNKTYSLEKNNSNTMKSEASSVDVPEGISISGIQGVDWYLSSPYSGNYNLVVSTSGIVISGQNKDMHLIYISGANKNLSITLNNLDIPDCAVYFYSEDYSNYSISNLDISGNCIFDGLAIYSSPQDENPINIKGENNASVKVILEGFGCIDFDTQENINIENINIESDKFYVITSRDVSMNNVVLSAEKFYISSVGTIIKKSILKSSNETIIKSGAYDDDDDNYQMGEIIFDNCELDLTMNSSREGSIYSEKKISFLECFGTIKSNDSQAIVPAPSFEDVTENASVETPPSITTLISSYDNIKISVPLGKSLSILNISGGGDFSIYNNKLEGENVIIPKGISDPSTTPNGVALWSATKIGVSNNIEIKILPEDKVGYINDVGVRAQEENSFVKISTFTDSSKVIATQVKFTGVEAKDEENKIEDKQTIGSNPSDQQEGKSGEEKQVRNTNNQSKNINNTWDNFPLYMIIGILLLAFSIITIIIKKAIKQN